MQVGFTVGAIKQAHRFDCGLSDQVSVDIFDERPAKQRASDRNRRQHAGEGEPNPEENQARTEFHRGDSALV